MDFWPQRPLHQPAPELAAVPGSLCLSAGLEFAGGGAVNDITEMLDAGVVMHNRRWSGDTHADLGGSVNVPATEQVMAKAADEIRHLRELLRLKDWVPS